MIGEILVTEETLSKQEFMDELKQSKVNVRAVQRGEKLFVFGSHLEVIATQDKDKKDSIAMYGKLLHQTFLITGNIEENSLTIYDPKLQADVLITHQPSSKKNSDVEVFKTLQPKMTVMSVDKKKRFKVINQEDKEVENAIYKTDKKGAIRFKGWSSWKLETVR